MSDSVIKELDTACLFWDSGPTTPHPPPPPPPHPPGRPPRPPPHPPPPPPPRPPPPPPTPPHPPPPPTRPTPTHPAARRRAAGKKINSRYSWAPRAGRGAGGARPPPAAGAGRPPAGGRRGSPPPHPPPPPPPPHPPPRAPPPPPTPPQTAKIKLAAGEKWLGKIESEPEIFMTGKFFRLIPRFHRHVHLKVADLETRNELLLRRAGV